MLLISFIELFFDILRFANWFNNLQAFHFQVYFFEIFFILNYILAIFVFFFRFVSHKIYLFTSTCLQSAIIILIDRTLIFNGNIKCGIWFVLAIVDNRWRQWWLCWKWWTRFARFALFLLKWCRKYAPYVLLFLHYF